MHILLPKASHGTDGFSLWSVLYVWANFDARAPSDSRARPLDRPAARRGRLQYAQARADADPAAGRALPARRDRAEQQAVRRSATALPKDRRATSELVARTEGAVPHRRGLLPRGGIRQGGAGVRGLPVLLPAASDRRPRAVPARDELLRSAQAGRVRVHRVGPAGGRSSPSPEVTTCTTSSISGRTR